MYGSIESPSWYPDLIELSQHFLDMSQRHRQVFSGMARALAGGRGGEHGPLEPITPAVLAEVP